MLPVVAFLTIRQTAVKGNDSSGRGLTSPLLYGPLGLRVSSSGSRVWRGPVRSLDASKAVKSGGVLDQTLNIISQ